jgi:tetratricopeptide (TPR) repeat protein
MMLTQRQNGYWHLPDQYPGDNSLEIQATRSLGLQKPSGGCVIMKTQMGKFFILVWLAVGLSLSPAAFAQSRNPKAVEQLRTGIELKKKGDIAGAQARYHEAIRLDPRYAEAHYNQAILLAERGDLNEAISEYKKTIDLDRNYAEAHFNLALLLRRKGDKDGEISEYERAIAAAPNYANAHFNLANGLVERGDNNGAIAHYEQFLKLSPKARDADQVKQMIKKLRAQR